MTDSNRMAPLYVAALQLFCFAMGIIAGANLQASHDMKVAHQTQEQSHDRQ